MDRVSSNTVNNSQNRYPIDLLAELSDFETNGCLKVFNKSLTYFIYLKQGKLIYISNSIAPFERLERQIRRLSSEVKTLTNEVRTQVRLNFFDANILNHAYQLSDYQAICWLVEQQYINKSEAELITKRSILEVFESFLLLSNDFQVNLSTSIDNIPVFCQCDLSTLSAECRKRLQDWQAFSPLVSSSYQRPYLFVKSESSPQLQKLGKILRGFSFRQLAALLNQDELILVKQLYPLILRKKIILREPQHPFEQLPKISHISHILTEKSSEQDSFPGQDHINFVDFHHSPNPNKVWKIVSIDDSKTILSEISRFLESENISLLTIDEPLRALMKIISFRPDLILLDVGMPNIDGYKLCSLIRKYSAFKYTPIIMVTGHKGLIDRAKARLAGATDYMTKPFSQSDLLTMVFRYLT